MFNTKPPVTATGRLIAGMLLSLALAALPISVMARTALIETPLGDIEIELLSDDAPNTVENFVRYVEDNKYINSFIHRSVPGFVIQGGGFTYNGSSPSGIIPYASVANEFKVSNTRGTVAMAKISGNPDSATSQWFINLADNSENLDNTNGGFTVFAVVTSGMEVADAIAELPIINADGPFVELPLMNYNGGFITQDNLVFTQVSVEPSATGPFVMNAGLNDAWYNPITDGQGFFITVFPDLGAVNLAWFTYDTELPDESATANLGDPGHRWLTAIGPIDGNTAVLDINFASGGLFDTATEIQNTDPPGSAGTITLTFTDCNTGLVEYDITTIGMQGSVEIQRVANDNIALCESLRAEAAQ
jgi:peptidyl-prolyl cis-trans isomerase A (cyclophilin A)